MLGEVEKLREQIDEGQEKSNTMETEYKNNSYYFEPLLLNFSFSLYYCVIDNVWYTVQSYCKVHSRWGLVTLGMVESGVHNLA